MINIKDLKDKLEKCITKNNNIQTIEGNSIIFGVKIGFDAEKLENIESDIAQVLYNAGANEVEEISLDNISKNKNGESWNIIQNLEDIETLNLLVASADALELINNNDLTQKENAKKIGEYYQIVLSSVGRQVVNNDRKWVGFIRDYISKSVSYPTNPELIESFAKKDLDEKTFIK